MTEKKKPGRPKKVTAQAEVAEEKQVVKEPNLPRKKRVPISRMKDLLTASNREGYVRRWVNDNERGTRIAMFENAGWTLVNDEVAVGDKGVTNKNNSLTLKGARTHVGKGMYAYLMEIKKEYYDEDQEAKEAELRKVDEALQMQSKEQGRYGEIKIS